MDSAMQILPSLRSSLPFDWYQFKLLRNRRTCKQLAQDYYLTAKWLKVKLATS